MLLNTWGLLPSEKPARERKSEALSSPSHFHNGHRRERNYRCCSRCNSCNFRHHRGPRLRWIGRRTWTQHELRLLQWIPLGRWRKCQRAGNESVSKCAAHVMNYCLETNCVKYPSTTLCKNGSRFDKWRLVTITMVIAYWSAEVAKLELESIQIYCICRSHFLSLFNNRKGSAHLLSHFYFRGRFSCSSEKVSKQYRG